jgi:flagellin-like protein
MLKGINSKKGVSEVIGYVLLILIVVVISVFVYAYLRTFVPREREMCPSDRVSLIVRTYMCDSGNKILNLTLVNQGFFTLSAFTLFGSNDSASTLATKNLTGNRGYVVFPQPIKPGETTNYSVNYESVMPLKFIEITPYYLTDKNKSVICSDSIVKETLNGCS